MVSNTVEQNTERKTSKRNTKSFPSKTAHLLGNKTKSQEKETYESVLREKGEVVLSSEETS